MIYAARSLSRPGEPAGAVAVVRDMRLKTQVSVAEREVVPTVTQALSAG